MPGKPGRPPGGARRNPVTVTVVDCLARRSGWRSRRGPYAHVTCGLGIAVIARHPSGRWTAPVQRDEPRIHPEIVDHGGRRNHGHVRDDAAERAEEHHPVEGISASSMSWVTKATVRPDPVHRLAGSCISRRRWASRAPNGSSSSKGVRLAHERPGQAGRRRIRRTTRGGSASRTRAGHRIDQSPRASRPIGTGDRGSPAASRRCAAHIPPRHERVGLGQ